MRKSFWKSDWFAAVVIVLVVMVLGKMGMFDRLDLAVYDFGVTAAHRTPSDKINIVAIDDASVSDAKLGRWPWPRDVQAHLVDILGKAGAKVIVSTILLSEAQRDPGLGYIEKIDGVYKKHTQAAASAATASSAATTPALEADWADIGSIVADAKVKLDTDTPYAAAIKQAGNVLLPLSFGSQGDPVGNPDSPLPDYVLANALPTNAFTSVDPVPFSDPSLPLAQFGKNSAGIGVLDQVTDADGKVRVEPLVVHYYSQIFPSLSLLAAAKQLNLKLDDINIDSDFTLHIGRLKVESDANALLQTYYYPSVNNVPPFPIDSFYDVYSGKINPEKYKGQLVLIGTTANGVGQRFSIPGQSAVDPAVLMGSVISDLLQQDFVSRPRWTNYVTLCVTLLVAAYLIGLMPRLRAGVAAGATVALLTAMLATSFWLLASRLLWLQLMLPFCILAIGHLLLTTKRFLMTERGKERSEAESAESNRMLGLAFQGQGQLDMAFDKFRKVPLDDSMMDLLYNLALDFERKRQFNKSVAVFEHMASHNPKYKDLAQRLKRAKSMEETVILGGSGKGTNSTIIVDGAVEKPMLGRYQVEKELGKGAMGVVYLGKDPKISRVVAIKTMALSQEFDPEELEEVRARFFREAETAGRLNHPNIVTIYDAGEEHDLAYIAMEFLKGKDLVPQSKAANLLPLPDVLAIVRQVADALSYAHSQNVVHRDIKPANIMYEPQTKTVKVTDFGIARITDSSRTKTGLVLGTPSYMSPEQLSGKKIDGRSDLFSLGVMLYQLCVGQLPFTGESMAELMYRIANEPHRNIRDVNPEMPIALAAIINKALAKQPEQRFQTGAEMADAIRLCETALGHAG